MDLERQKFRVTRIDSEDVARCAHINVEVLWDVRTKVAIFVTTIVSEDLFFVLAGRLFSIADQIFVSQDRTCYEFLFISKEHIFRSLANQVIILYR